MNHQTAACIIILLFGIDVKREGKERREVGGTLPASLLSCQAASYVNASASVEPLPAVFESLDRNPYCRQRERPT